MFDTIRDKIERRNRRNRTKKELHSLSDRELSDIGLTRSGIKDILRSI